MDINETKMIHWLDHFNITYDCEIKKKQKTFVRRHVSGHASKKELKELIEKINPTTIIPIHTTNPKQFKKIFQNKIILPKNNQPITI